MNISISDIFNRYKKECIVFAVFLFTFGPIFQWMWDRWFVHDSYYSHGILIPFVVVYLIWQLREELKATKREESPLGIWLVALGLFIYFISNILRIYFTSGFSMLLVLVGLVLHFFGERILIKIAFPLFFLSFMIPLPMVAIANLSFKLKLMAAKIATFMLNHFMGVLALQEGSMIKMRHAVVVVEDVCSGLRSLISLTALGAIFAYYYKGSVIKRMIVFLSTIPIAVATNVCRILFLAVVSEVWGTQYATGLIHDISGFMVFGLAFLMLMSVTKLLDS